MDFTTQSNQTLLKERLKNETLQVSFTKKDGSERTMRCTLSATVLPVSEEKTSTRSVPTSSLAVFDVDKQEWRSFRWDSIIDVKLA